MSKDNKVTKLELSEVKHWTNLIEDMVDSGDFVKHEEFLLDVGEWIEENMVITDNIENRIMEIREEI